MTVESAIGSRFFFGGYDISGDVGQIGTARLTVSPIDVTSIDVSAAKRIRGRIEGELAWNVFFNDAAAQEHVALKSLARTDQYAMWAHQCAAIGDSGIAMKGKQINYDWNLGQDGGLLGSVQMLGQGTPIEPGVLLTPGKRTDTGATNGSSLDDAAATNFGCSAYCFLTDFSGTDITITLEDSANNSAFATFTGSSFGQFTGVGAARLQTGIATTVRRYTRVATSTSGGFSSATFVVLFARHTIAPPLWP